MQTLGAQVDSRDRGQVLLQGGQIVDGYSDPHRAKGIWLVSERSIAVIAGNQRACLRFDLANPVEIKVAIDLSL